MSMAEMLSLVFDQFSRKCSSFRVEILECPFSTRTLNLLNS